MTKKEAVKWATLFLAYANGKEVRNSYGDGIEKLTMCIPDCECLNTQSVEDFNVEENEE